MIINSSNDNFIKRQNQISNNNYSKMQTIRMGLSKDKLSFGAKTIDERMKEERSSKSWWGRNISWTFGGEEKARKQAVSEINNEINQKERELKTTKADHASDNARHNELIINQTKILKAKEETIEAQKKLEDSQKQTIFHLKETVSSQEQLIKYTAEANEKLETLYLEQKMLVENHKKTVEELLEKMDKAKAENDAKLQEALKEQMETMQKSHKEQMEELAKSINTVSDKAEIFKKIKDKTNIKGFGKIAGYQEQIDILLDHFGTPIALQKSGQSANIPGGILFFGPTGTGKSTFASAFAGQLDCHFEILKAKMQKEVNSKLKISKLLGKSGNENYDNLMKILNDAKKRYKENKEMTVVEIKEFEAFAPKKSEIVGPMKDLMDTITQDYHCIIFATTNYPERIDEILLRDGRFYKAGLPPADKKNAVAVLKHYAADFAEKGVNYEELAEEIVKVQPDAAFSNAGIETSIRQLVEKTNDINIKFTQKEIKDSIKKVGPDIGKAALKVFEENLRLMKRI